MNRCKMVCTALVVLLVSGCLGSQNSKKDIQLASMDTYRSTCTNYGFKVGTNAHAECMQREKLGSQQQQMQQKRKLNCALQGSYKALKPYTGYTTTPTNMGQVLGAMGQGVAGCQ